MITLSNIKSCIQHESKKQNVLLVRSWSLTHCQARMKSSTRPLISSDCPSATQHTTNHIQETPGLYIIQRGIILHVRHKKYCYLILV